jgi:hypothetical protein
MKGKSMMIVVADLIDQMTQPTKQGKNSEKKVLSYLVEKPVL